MNYIKRLEAENLEKGAEIVGYAHIIEEIKRYLALPKFNWPEDWVNIKDILRIIEQGEQRKTELVNDQARINKERIGG